VRSNDCNQQLATLDYPSGPMLWRVCWIAWLELRCHEGQANACFDCYSGQIMRGPASIDDNAAYLAWRASPQSLSVSGTCEPINQWMA